MPSRRQWLGSSSRSRTWFSAGRYRRHDCGSRLSSCCRPATPARRRSSGRAGERPGRASRCRAGCPADPPVRRDSGRCRRAAWRRGAGRCGKTCPTPARGCCRGGWHDPRRRVRPGRSAPFPTEETSPPRGGRLGSLFLVLSSWFFADGSRLNERDRQHNKHERTMNRQHQRTKNEERRTCFIVRSPCCCRRTCRSPRPCAGPSGAAGCSCGRPGSRGDCRARSARRACRAGSRRSAPG